MPLQWVWMRTESCVCMCVCMCLSFNVSCVCVCVVNVRLIRAARRSPDCHLVLKMSNTMGSGYICITKKWSDFTNLDLSKDRISEGTIFVLITKREMHLWLFGQGQKVEEPGWKERERDEPMLRHHRRCAHARMRLGKAHQSCTPCGVAFFKKPREAAAVPFSHKSVMTRWLLGCDWPRTVWISRQRWKVKCNMAAWKWHLMGPEDDCPEGHNKIRFCS